MKKEKTIRLAIALCLLIILSACAGTKTSTVLTPPVVSAPSQTNAAVSKITTKTEAPASASASSGTQTSQSQSKLKLYLNGNKLTLNTAPKLEGDMVMVPVVPVCKAFSRTITCTAAGQTLTLKDEKKGKEIVITAGQANAKVNGADVAMKAAAALDGSEMFIELSAFKTLLDADTKYNKEFSSAYITESGLC